MGLEVGGGGTEEKEEEKIPLCESIGHSPLWGRCPKGGGPCELEQHPSQFDIQCLITFDLFDLHRINFMPAMLYSL